MPRGGSRMQTSSAPAAFLVIFVWPLTLGTVIDFSRSFNLAWERMVHILFQPFDLAKWFTIGFCAFLAGLLTGGNGFNFSGSGNPMHASSISPQQQQIEIQHQFSHLTSWFSAWHIWMVVMLAVTVFLLTSGLILVLNWLGARGQFMFLDNVVRNRGTVAWPWHAYARQGNRVFVLHLICFALSMALVLVMATPAVLIAFFILPHHPGLGIAGVVGAAVWFLLFFAMMLAFALVLFLFRDWGIPLMFRHDITALAALREIWSLVKRHPGSIALYLLLRLALAIGLIVMSVAVCCLTCCVGALPYLGTVILLPVLIFIRCFSLECLAQLGPNYSVWVVDQAPTGPASVTPPPPL